MNDIVLREALGSLTRDFKKNPLTQDEIYAVIAHCEREIVKHRLDPELTEVYVAAIDVLLEHVKH